MGTRNIKVDEEQLKFANGALWLAQQAGIDYTVAEKALMELGYSRFNISLAESTIESVVASLKIEDPQFQPKRTYKGGRKRKDVEQQEDAEQPVKSTSSSKKSTVSGKTKKVLDEIEQADLDVIP